MGLVSYTREQMEEIIKAGGSVLHRGEVISHPDQLPAPEDLAAGNPDEEAAVAAALDAQIATLQARRATMGSAASAPTPRGGAGTSVTTKKTPASAGAETTTPPAETPPATDAPPA